jgi:hypothetical protein
VDRLTHLCPYLDRRDARCSGLLTLMNLNEAFRLCAGNHELCTVYHQIRAADVLRERGALVAEPV